MLEKLLFDISQCNSVQECSDLLCKFIDYNQTPEFFGSSYNKALVLLKQANDAHTNNYVDSWFTSNKEAVNKVLSLK